MAASDNYCEYVSKIKSTLWKTQSSRFNAARRLNNKYQFSAISISLLSILGIGTPIIQNFIDSTKCATTNQLYTLVSILLSIFILVLSLLESSQNYQLKADKLHDNAVNISSLLKEIEFLINCKFPNADSEEKKYKIITEIQRYYKEYDNLIKLCPENHEPDDYLFFQAEHYKDFEKSWFWSQRTLIRLRIKYYWLYFMLVMIIAVIILSLYLSCPI